jgi:hypothetical protein
MYPFLIQENSCVCYFLIAGLTRLTFGHSLEKSHTLHSEKLRTLSEAFFLLMASLVLAHFKG